jgi:uncharacterized protein (DUF1697 family)
MPCYVALLRAVNVGGTGKLPMNRLTAMCVAAGFTEVRTYIASGNVVFDGRGAEADVRAELSVQLEAYAGKPVDVIVRSAAVIADVVARNPFANEPGNRVMAWFSDAALPADPVKEASGLRNEQVRLGKRELFVFYPDGQGRSRLRIPSMKSATARNMNTVAKLAAMAAR